MRPLFLLAKIDASPFSAFVMSGGKSSTEKTSSYEQAEIKSTYEYKPGECQETYVPGDSRPMCEPWPTMSSSPPTGATSPKLNSQQELSCLTRLVIERKRGGNSMSDREIAVLCDSLFK